MKGWHARSWLAALATVAALSPVAPVAAQACLGTGLSEGGGTAVGRVGAVSGVPVVGAAVFRDPASPIALLGQAELALPDDGHGIHLGGRGVYKVGPPLGAMLCLTLGASFYRSQVRFDDVEGRRHTGWFRIYAPAAGLAGGFFHASGPMVVNPYALAEGQLLFKQMRFDDPYAARGDRGGWDDYSNEARAVLELGVGVHRHRLLLDAALLMYPGTHSLLEAFRGDDPAGGLHAGFRLGLGAGF